MQFNLIYSPTVATSEGLKELVAFENGPSVVCGFCSETWLVLLFIVKCVREFNICDQTKGFIQHLSYLLKSYGIKMRINSQRAPTRA